MPEDYHRRHRNLLQAVDGRGQAGDSAGFFAGSAAAEEFGWSIPGQKGKRRQYLVMEEQHAI
jgi:hypothetical protein